MTAVILNMSVQADVVQTMFVIYQINVKSHAVQTMTVLTLVAAAMVYAPMK